MVKTHLPSDQKLTEPAQLKKFPEFDNHQLVIELNDEPTGLKAFVAIHNTNLGIALGGTRFTHYDSETAALKDVLNLSRAMSYKCALALLPYGGGKAVIMRPASLKNQADLLAAYARLVDKLDGLFKTGTDVGITDDDVAQMANETSHMLGVVAADRGDLNTSKVAALGVFYAHKAVLKQLYDSTDFKGRSVAIKGAGKLGGELARLIIEAGGSVFASDIDNQQVADLKQQLPSVTIIPNTSIHKQAVDIYAPCALGNEFNRKTIAELACKAVAGGANNQLAEPESGDLLDERGILYAPDYVANAGGLIYVADELEPGGFNKQRVIERTKVIEQTLSHIFKEAAKEHLPTYLVADRLAQTRIRGAEHG